MNHLIKTHNQAIHLIAKKPGQRAIVSNIREYCSLAPISRISPRCRPSAYAGVLYQCSA
jgi:hypothetical protein